MNILGDIVRGFKAEIVARVLYFLTTGVTLIFLARSLSPDAYGILFLAFSILTVGQLFGDLRVPDSAARYIAEQDESDRNRVSYIAVFSFKVVLVASTAMAVAVIAFHRQIAALFDEPALAPVLLVGSAIIFSQSFYWYFRKLLQGFKSIRSSAVVYGGEGVGRLAFVVVFVLLGFGSAGAIGGYALGYASAAVLGAIAFYRYIYPTIEVPPRGDLEIRDRVLEYAVPLLATRGARVVDNSLDTVIVGFFLAPTAVGFYTLSKQATHLLQAPASALGFSTGPWFGDQKASGDVTQVADIYTKSLMYTLLLYIPATAGLILLARPALLIIFGQDYLPATDVLQIFAVFATLQSVEEVSENSIDYLGRARERSIAKGVTAIASIAAIALLVPVVGIVGAAIARVGTHAVYVVTLLYIMYAEVGFDVHSIGRDVVQILAISGGMSVVVFYVSRYIDGVVSLMAVVALGAAIWGALSVLLGLLDTKMIKSFID